MYRVAIALSAILLAACGKETKPPPTIDAGPVSTTIDAGAVPTIEYGPAVFHPQACADAGPAPRSPIRGCESCKPDELCEQFSVRGNRVGQCKKHECRKDADCSKTSPGFCGCGIDFGPNKCWAGNCRNADDCGGRDCVGTWCRTKDDTCKTNADCKPEDECRFDGAKFACQKRPPPLPPG